MSSAATTSNYLSHDIHYSQMSTEQDILPDDKSFVLGAEQHYSDVASASNCVVSPRGLFRVFRYHSYEGEGGMPIVVTVNFSHRQSETTYLRIVVGRRALNTTVRQISKSSTWELEAVVPNVDNETSLNPVVPITVQALTDSNGILDAVTVGSYTYWTVTTAVPFSRRSTDRDSTDSLRQEFAAASLGRSQSCPSSGHARRASLSLSPRANHPAIPRSRTSSTRSSGRSRTNKALTAIRVGKKQALMRTRRSGPEELPESHRAVLELLMPLDTMCTNWDPDELKAGRRLVRFIRSQEGYKVKLSCECIKQDDYVEGDTVISCIHRRDTDTCYVTSVDIIFLLESIVGEEFEIEEKNRIRRNLEGFRPKTISKNRVGSESFFQQIMDFPAPKPRNIEKDVKVFEWNVLPQALEKIISKYSLYYSLDGSDRSTPGTASPNDAVTFKSSPESIPTFSPSTSASDIPEHPDGGDQFLYAADSFESGQTGAFSSRGEIPQTIPFLARTETIGSYGPSDAPSLMASSSGNPEGGALAYQPVYRLMPSTQAFPMSDTPVAATNIMSGEEYHSFEDRIRSPVSYF